MIRYFLKNPVFFKRFHVSPALKATNAYKKKGFPVVSVFRYLFLLIFSNRSMYTNLMLGRNLPQFCKDTAYRFMKMGCINWICFITTLSSRIVNPHITLLVQTYPGTNDFFDSPARSDGSQKWGDFIYTYWHVDCVRDRSLPAFTEHYQNWRKRKGYNFSTEKAEKVYRASCDFIAVFPKDDNTKMLIHQAVAILNTVSEPVEALRLKLDEAASMLPEYSIVMAMDGVGSILGTQFMAVIGDVACFTHRGALTAFAGVDSGKNDSGKHIQKSVPTTKKVLHTCTRPFFKSWTGLSSARPLMTLFILYG